MEICRGGGPTSNLNKSRRERQNPNAVCFKTDAVRDGDGLIIEDGVVLALWFQKLMEQKSVTGFVETREGSYLR